VIIKIDNPILSDNEKTWLTQAVADGTTALTVKSNEGFSADDYIVIGEVGEEESEAVKISSTTGDHTITLAVAVKHGHTQGTPIYFTRWDKYSLEVKPTGGDYSAVAGMPVDIEWDSEFSEHIYSGATTDSYRFRFYNSQTAAYSSYSPIVAGTGYTRKSARYMTNNVLKIANDPDAKVLNRDEIRYQFNAAQDYVSAMNNRWWFLWKEGDAISSVASTEQYGFLEDWSHLKAIICHFDDGTDNIKYRLERLPKVEYEYETRDQDRDDDDDIKYFCIYQPDSTYSYGSFKVQPTPEHAYHTFYPLYYKKMADLADDNDETDIPIPQILEYWALSQIEKARGNQNKSEMYMKNFEGSVALLKQDQKKYAGPKTFLAYRGRKVMRRLYGDRRTFSDEELAKYW